MGSGTGADGGWAVGVLPGGRRRRAEGAQPGSTGRLGHPLCGWIACRYRVATTKDNEGVWRWRRVEIGLLITVMGLLAGCGTNRPAASRSSTSLAPTTTATSISVPLSSVNWSAAVRPAMQCATYDANSSLGLTSFPASVYQVGYFSPLSGVSLAIVLARCAPGIGDPPVGLFAFDRATSSTTAHVSQVLIDPNRDLQASGFTIDGSIITMAVSGYSSSDADCCPSLQNQATWAWQNGAFTGSPPEVVEPSPLMIEVSTSPGPVTSGQPAQATVRVTNNGSIPITDLEIDGWNGVNGIPSPNGYWTLASLAPGRSATFTATIPASQYTNTSAAPHYGVTFAASGQIPTGSTGTPWTAVELRIES